MVVGELDPAARLGQSDYYAVSFSWNWLALPILPLPQRSPSVPRAADVTLITPTTSARSSSGHCGTQGLARDQNSARDRLIPGNTSALSGAARRRVGRRLSWRGAPLG